MVKKAPVSAGGVRDLGSIPGSGNGSPLQYSCLGNSMDRGTWRTTVHGVVKSQTQLNMHTHTHTHTAGPLETISPFPYLPPSVISSVSLRFKCNTVHLYLMHSIVLVDQIEFESNSAI